MPDVTVLTTREVLAGAVGGQACDVRLGHGSFLTFSVLLDNESGTPGTQYYFWLYCTVWRVETDHCFVCGSEDKRESLASDVSVLNGLRLVAIDVEWPSLSLCMSFENGVRLRTFSIYRDDAEHWKVELPDNSWITAGPGSTLRLTE